MSTKYKYLDPEGIYFVTFATVDWIDIFTRVEYKEILLNSIRFCQKEKGMVLHCWCFMTNHVHLIFSCTNKGEHSNIMRDLKKFTSKQLIDSIRKNPSESRKAWILELLRNAGLKNSNNTEFQFWQQDNHPIEVYSPKVISQKIQYIHNNPVKEGIVIEPQHYVYSSACDYSGIKGLLEVEILDIPSSLVGYVFGN